jgi:hypothetical protein
LKFKSIFALPTQVVAWGSKKRKFKEFEKELEKLLPTLYKNAQLPVVSFDILY